MAVTAGRGLKVRVRRASSRDVKAACELFGGYLEFYGVDADRRRVRSFLSARLAGRDSLILLAEVAPRKPVGFAQIYPSFSSLSLAPTWIMNDLYVLTPARRSGVARALIGGCLVRAEKAGVTSIELKTARSNAPARSLYEIVGFERETDFICYHRSANQGRQA